MSRRWVQLRKEIEDAKGDRNGDWRTAIIRELKRAVQEDVCDSWAPFRLSSSGPIEPKGTTVAIPVRNRSVPAIPLKNLKGLVDARLTFRIETVKNRLLHYTMTLVGNERSSGRRWHVRIDLDEAQKGQGPCGHATLHCHVGGDPGDGDAQPCRVPLPWLDPQDALAWILATVHPALEPQEVGQAADR